MNSNLGSAENESGISEQIEVEQQEFLTGSVRLEKNVAKLKEKEPQEKDELPLRLLSAKMGDILDKFVAWLKTTEKSDLFTRITVAGAIAGMVAGGVNIAGIKNISDKLPSNVRELLQSPETMANPVLFAGDKGNSGVTLSVENYRENLKIIEGKIASGEQSETGTRVSAAVINLAGGTAMSEIGFGLALVARGLLKLKKEEKA